ncbi:hypothetical protein RND81_04G140700 [Saponaria officinalis]|uniref:Lipoxygenase n=1 Tax=Saponaria officinalis TaxID=3572 RepID=A0AAW1LPG8_SAPOF
MASVKQIMGTLPTTQKLSSLSSLLISSTKFMQISHNFRNCPFSSYVPRKGRKLLIVKSKSVISEDYYVKQSQPSDVVSFNHNGSSKIKVKVVVTVRNKIKEDLKELIVKRLDNLCDIFGRNVVLQLVSTKIDPRTRGPKKSGEAVLKDWSKKSKLKAEKVNYFTEFMVDSNFGKPGAILVTNKHQQEFYLESITLEGFALGPLHFPCNSWVQSFYDLPTRRIFFHNKPYLPHETPAGLRALREKELKELRGDGKGERKLSDRIYEYDVYNDLGKPDKSSELTRPILGGKAIPYPRRCRTGRPLSVTDPRIETRVEKPLPIYVPRDEQFEEQKSGTFSFCRLRAVLHNILPSLTTNISSKHDFTGFKHLDTLFNEGLILNLDLNDDLVKKLPKFVTKLRTTTQAILKFDTPTIVAKDKLAWMRDDEFARQFLAGVNPLSIERMTCFPPVSKLDPEEHGYVESALNDEHILGHLDGMSVQEALDKNRLYIVDYHDIYLPFLDRINSQDGRKAYATRTVFFLTSAGTLMPIAIELSVSGSNSKSKRVVNPPVNATTNWMWQIAKAHVCANDAGVHQLVQHWLRTHATLEPFILAAHRRLSCMHPIYKLVEPHMRYTLHINALARQNLINCDGVIEDCFTPGKYAMEISAAAYKTWRFDVQDLPSDLIQRGIAVPDSTQPHGLRLLIKDYPYATDGLLIWDAINKWVRDYVTHYYTDPSLVSEDRELQSWYNEAVKVGHADVSDAPWWPILKTPEDLIKILSTLIWLASAQHAALNYGQYPYGGYMPNRPVLMRRLIPNENDPEYVSFLSDPQKYYFTALPGVLQTSKFIAVIDTLSTHSPDEEYLGERPLPSTWTGDPKIIEKFFEFSAEMRKIEEEIERRNNDPSLRNRCGAGIIPYELMAPSSEPGVTCRGVPNSITI